MENNLNNNPPEKWYQKIWWLVILLFVIGPLALPAVWRNPRLSRNTKIAITLAVLALTIWATIVFIKTLKSMDNIYNQQLEILQGYGIK